MILGKNNTKKFVPASTLKIFTASAAIHYLSPAYRFKTDFYLSENDRLTVKGYGDPLLISEVWEEMAMELAQKIKHVGTIVLDDSYFERDITVPGAGQSTNPYDAPLGALCANFNTVFFTRDRSGEIMSAEPQTPLTALARQRIASLGEKKGRYTFTHEHDDISRYAGQILAYFLQKNNVAFDGRMESAAADGKDNLLYTYQSRFTLQEAIQKMLEFSNNFTANQIIVAMGAHQYGPPGTLSKGVDALHHYARTVLHLADLSLVEGSGISRSNEVTAQDMIAILKAFEPYRHLLVRDGPFQYKTGTLSGIRTRAGYVEAPDGSRYYFVVSVKTSGQMTKTIDTVKEAVLRHCAVRSKSVEPSTVKK
jgi:D-alanyl-D-alanine carboxypeptidase/D-alanyl-D-alanine-endopeptidase (penicillin-binding protein 4)